MCSGLNSGLLKAMFVYLEPQNVALCGIRVFADVIKRRSCWRRVSPKSKDECPWKRQRRRQADTERPGRRPRDEGGGDPSDASPSRRTPRMAGSPRSPERVERIFLQSLRENRANSLILDF